MGIHFDADLASSGFAASKLAFQMLCGRAPMQVVNDEGHCCGKSVQLEKTVCPAGLFGFRTSDQLWRYCYSGARVFHRWHAAGGWESDQWNWN
jgi:hypothetical protein